MINSSLNPDMTVSQVVELWPAAVPVFARHGIDLCCGGSKTLGFAAQAHGIDLHGLVEELAEAMEGEVE
jgi:iron-sulfur cluster repair protein YtfE (RIC family)